MKFLREEKIALLAFTISVLIISAIFYFAVEFSPKVDTVAPECEVGCPIYAPCQPGCVKKRK